MTQLNAGVPILAVGRPHIVWDGPIAPATVLRTARWYLSDRNRWEKGVWARTSDGVSCGANNPMASCWCASGALERASRDLELVHTQVTPWLLGTSFDYLLKVIRSDDARRSWSIPHWNDYALTTHAELLQGFDAAIGLAEDDVAMGRIR